MDYKTKTIARAFLWLFTFFAITGLISYITKLKTSAFMLAIFITTIIIGVVYINDKEK